MTIFEKYTFSFLKWGPIMGLIWHFVLGCGNPEATNGSDEILAQVHGKTLYLSELDGMIPANVSSEDSLLFINGFIERWIREAVLLQEAELNMPKDLNIDKLVRDYRASLLKHNYELILVEQLLDSTVTESEIQDFYQENQPQFVLDEPILRCQFVKLFKNEETEERFQKLWKNWEKDGGIQAMMVFANNQAVSQHLTDSTWYNLPMLAAEMPPGWLTKNNVNKSTSFVKSDDQFTYFFRVLELIDEGEEPPISYVEPKIKRLILHQRKQSLLEGKKEEMYERELRQNNIKVLWKN